MNLKELRTSNELSQKECALLLNIPLRTYVRYETEEEKECTQKYEYILEKLKEMTVIDEEHGILKLKNIISTCTDIFKKYNVEYCYLFGSYARNEASPTSDVDLFISMPVNGLKFYELIEDLREGLHKKIDLLDTTQIKNNPALALSILTDGIKIYVKE